MNGGDSKQDKHGAVIVYSCSGCSNVAQAANTLAVRLDREGLAEMSCIAGVGAIVPSLVRVAQSPRPKLVIDGCPLACCHHAMRRHGVSPDVYIDLSKHGCRKRLKEDLEPEELERLWHEVVLPSLAQLGPEASAEGGRGNK